jgi:hypothetical protein
LNTFGSMHIAPLVRRYPCTIPMKCEEITRHEIIVVKLMS